MAVLKSDLEIENKRLRSSRNSHRSRCEKLKTESKELKSHAICLRGSVESYRIQLTLAQRYINIWCGTAVALALLLGGMFSYSVALDTATPATEAESTAAPPSPAITAIEASGDDPAWRDEIPAAIETKFVQTKKTPAYVLASVHMANNNSCSGTVLGHLARRR